MSAIKRHSYTHADTQINNWSEMSIVTRQMKSNEVTRTFLNWWISTWSIVIHINETVTSGWKLTWWQRIIQIGRLITFGRKRERERALRSLALCHFKPSSIIQWATTFFFIQPAASTFCSRTFSLDWFVFPLASNFVWHCNYSRFTFFFFNP